MTAPQRQVIEMEMVQIDLKADGIPNSVSSTPLR